MSKNPIEFIRHIKDECLYILSINETGIAFDDFLNDETLKRAIVRSLEVIGEATKKFRQISKSNGIRLSGNIWQECVTD